MCTTRTFRNLTSALVLPTLMLAVMLGLFSGPSSALAARSPGGNPNVDCPAGTELIAKFNWNGSSYAFEKPAGNEGIVTISGDATSGSWASTTPISTVIIKGGTGTYTYSASATSGSFSKVDLPLNNGEQSPAISNIQFCGGATHAPGGLVVTKIVDWNGSDPYDATFEFCITGPSYPAGNCQSLTFNGSTRDATGKETATVSWSGLAPGSYMVTENGTDSTWQVTGSGQTVMVSNGATAQATITNRCTFTNP